MKNIFGLVIFLLSAAAGIANEKDFLAANMSDPDKATLSGYVLAAESEETIIGATITVDGTKLGAYTNKSGFFSIQNIPPGRQIIRISSISYEKFTDTIRFTKGESIRRNFLMAEKSVLTEEITVDARRQEDKRQITISKVDVPIEQIKQIRIGGESDVFRSLQFLPGILTSSQISSGLFVRGGSPDQNLVLLDGSTVYNPTHLFGFISTFNPDAVKDVELIKGGFQAEYGGRLSAVLNITQKDGNRKEFNGVGSIGAISSRISMNGPVGNGSWFLGGRRTYFELIKAFIPEDPEEPIPDFNFYDINAKVEQDLSPNDKIFISGFTSADELNFDGLGIDLVLGISNIAGSARWTHIFSDNIFTNLILSGSSYDNGFEGGQSGYEFLVENTIRDYTAKGSLEWFYDERTTLKTGFEITSYEFNYLQEFGTDSAGAISEPITDILIKDWNYSAYFQGNFQFSDLFSIQAGLRSTYFELNDHVKFSPRFAARYQLQENMALKGAFGIYHQNLRLASQPDFSFFDTWLPTDTTMPISSAYHFIVSLETQPWDGYDLNFDGYYKNFSDVSELDRYILQAETTDDVFLLGNSESWGFEVFMQKKFGRLSGWMGYAIGWIESVFPMINKGEPFRPKYDRRHDFKIVGNYRINDRWQVGATFTFQSGQSYTGATSRFQSTLEGQKIGRAILYPSERYGLRLPPSHQLNISGSYSFKMFDLPAKAILDVYNVYNRRDIWFRYYNTRSSETVVEDVRLLPILPTVSLEIEF